MSKRPEVSTDPQLLSLFSGLCDGTLTEAEGRQLDAALSGSQHARRAYASYFSMHAHLFWHEEGGLDAPAAVPSITQPVRGLSFGRRWMQLALAASLLIGVGLGALGMRAVVPSSKGPLAGLGGAESLRPGQPVIARITGTRNCRWDASNTAIGYGSPLRRGEQLKLLEGLAEITYAQGARVILEAPAEFEVKSPNGSQLLLGRMTATVPEQARGFQVDMDSLTLVDYGTEFGVVADANGTTEIHVFDGLVEGQLRNSQGRTVRAARWKSNEAVRIERNTDVFKTVSLDATGFVRSFAPSTGPHEGLYAYEDFEYPTGPLNGQNGGFGWGGPWVDISADRGSTNRVGGGSLPFDGLAPSGNHASLVGVQNRARRVLSTTVGGVFDTVGLVENQDGVRLVGRDGSTLYVSFAHRTSETNQVFYGFELHRGDGNSNRVLCVGHGASETGYGITSEVNGGARPTFASLGPENSDVNFIVVKLEFGVDQDDIVTVYRDPESLRHENACRTDAQMRGNFAFDRVSIANFNGNKVHEVDRVRIGTSFEAVTGWRPEGSDFALPRRHRRSQLVSQPVETGREGHKFRVLLGALNYHGEYLTPALR